MSNPIVRVSTVYNKLCERRDEIVEELGIKDPARNPYIAGWDECIEYFYEFFEEGKRRDSK